MNPGIDRIQGIGITTIMRDTGEIPLDKGMTMTVYATDTENSVTNVIKRNVRHGANIIRKKMILKTTIKCAMVTKDMGKTATRINAPNGA